MPADLSKSLVIGTSSRALFDLEEANAVFEKDGEEASLMGGVLKTGILQAFRPHIFFDDQEAHCRAASEVVSTARLLPAALKTQRIVTVARAGSALAMEASTDVPTSDVPTTTLVASDGIAQASDSNS